eukprot:jgi/Botrbrau1/1002/Bobra.114_1s0040.1
MEDDRRPEDCFTRTGIAAGTGLLAGGFLGGVKANWSDVPLVLRDQPWPALVRTGRIMAQYGITCAAVGIGYASVECISEKLRGKKDWVNGVLGGITAGGVLGLRVGRVSRGIAAAVTFATASAVVTATGGKLVADVGIPDNVTPRRPMYPYPTSRPE